MAIAFLRKHVISTCCPPSAAPSWTAARFPANKRRKLVEKPVYNLIGRFSFLTRRSYLSKKTILRLPHYNLVALAVKRRVIHAMSADTHTDGPNRVIDIAVLGGSKIRVAVLASSVCAYLLMVCWASAEQAPVRHKEGLVHGFLVLRTLQGETLANGDLIQNVRGDRVTSRLVFRFKDGSIHDETAVFSQRGYFRLITDHLIQKGPAFEHPIELTVNAVSGQVTVRYTENGKEQSETEHLNLPADVANGLMLVLLKNVRAEIKVAFVAPTPKPRLVTLAVTPRGEEPFATGSVARKAMHYVVKVEIGGLTGVFAELLGRKPADTHVWILQGEAPAFVKLEGPLAIGGPIWRIELMNATWPSHSATEKRE
jgi:hypothetical protein